MAISSAVTHWMRWTHRAREAGKTGTDGRCSVKIYFGNKIKIN